MESKDRLILEQDLVAAVIRASERLIGRLSAALRPYGLSVPAYNVLRVLRGAGRGGSTCGEISRRLVTRVPDSTRLVDRLIKKGLVARERSEEDRRVVHVFLTEEGRKLLRSLDEPVLQVHRALFDGQDEEQLRAFRRELDLIFPDLVKT